MVIDQLFRELPATPFLQDLSAFLPDEINAYCVTCQTRHPMVNPHMITTKTGKAAASGKCPVCHTTMMKFLPNRYV
jgi:hypothetical protein